MMSWKTIFCHASSTMCATSSRKAEARQPLPVLDRYLLVPKLLPHAISTPYLPSSQVVGFSGAAALAAASSMALTASFTAVLSVTGAAAAVSCFFAIGQVATAEAGGTTWGCSPCCHSHTATTHLQIPITSSVPLTSDMLPR